MAADPYYNRKQVPDELIDGVGYTGLNPTDETAARERKLSREGGDLRKFWNPKGSDGKLDPYYQRKPVPNALIDGVGETGLTPEEEFQNRERKYSVNGVDVRKFGDSAKSGFHPVDDPYYGRKPVAKPEIHGVGEIDMTPAEAFQVREEKVAVFDLSSDPFQQLSGRGHRQSVSGGAAVEHAAQAQRRRSSAVAPHHHSGYDGDNKLAPIESRTEQEPGLGLSSNPVDSTQHHNTTTTTTTTTTTAINHGGTVHDATTRHADDVAPHELR